MFGKLTLEAIPYHEPIIMVTLAAVAGGALAILAAITYYRKWAPLWNDWLTSVDHKRIGVMYIILALVMLFRGFSDAVMMRAQQVPPPAPMKASCRRTTTTRSSPPMA